MNKKKSLTELRADVEKGAQRKKFYEVTVQNPLLTAGRSQHSRQKPQSMPHRR